ncbi:MAG TPA: S4 domain-containing protein YaaA [Bacillota bacterium]|nr:S4 domain-containing protein YaaA [Bacillota bacterium]
MKRISIVTEYITLGQLLKLVNLIGSGGEAKIYLANNVVYVNGEKDTRRGRKIYPGDRVKFGNQEYLIIVDET